MVRDIKKVKNVNSGLNLPSVNRYYDQSHFGKELKKIADLNPGLLFKNLQPVFPDLIVLK